MQYELCYLVGESKKPELEKIKSDVMEIVATEGGKFTETETLKERKMSYEVKKEIRGIYVTRRFDVAGRDDKNYNPETLNNITRKLNLYTNILRFILVRADELPELKTIEERIEKIKPVARPEARETKKPEFKKAEKPAEKKETAAELDKQLEEILNI